jgi:hypothetical protein
MLTWHKGSSRMTDAYSHRPAPVNEHQLKIINGWRHQSSEADVP